MTSGLRWTPEQLAAFRKRTKGAAKLALADPPLLRAEPKLGAEKPDSKLEALVVRDLPALGIPPPVRNYPFLAAIGRKHEIDFAWPAEKLGLEVDGGAHRTKKRFAADYEKHALALIGGWKILRVGSKDVRSGRWAEWLRSLWERR